MRQHIHNYYSFKCSLVQKLGRDIRDVEQTECKRLLLCTIFPCLTSTKGESVFVALSILRNYVGNESQKRTRAH